VTTDPDRVLVVQSRFAARRESPEEEHASVALDHGVRDHLLQVRLPLRVRALDEETVARDR